MIKVAITGEMGSGKTYCSKLFERLGVPVFYSDDVSKRLINEDIDLKIKIIAEFGDVYDQNGKIIPKLLASLVFAPGCKLRLEKLNGIVHPYVLRDYGIFCDINSNEPYTLVETALLYESNNLINVIDKSIYVCVPEKKRMLRTFSRSGISESEYKQRMKSQIDPEIKKKKSDFIIYNDDGDNVEQQIADIHNILLNL